MENKERSSRKVLRPRLIAQNFRLFWKNRNVVKNWLACFFITLFYQLRYFYDYRLFSQKKVKFKFKDGFQFFSRADTLGCLPTFYSYMDWLEEKNIFRKTIIDVGAHIGEFSVPAACLGAKVFAYEPDPINFQIIQDSKGLNEEGVQLEIFQEAVSGVDGTTTFYEGGHSTVGSIVDDPFFESRRGVKSNEMQVKVCGINTLFEKNKIEDCFLLKIDCEGSEYQVFKEIADEHLEKIDNIIMEIHPVSERKLGLSQLENRLKSKGFTLRSKEPLGYDCFEVFFSK